MSAEIARSPSKPPALYDVSSSESPQRFLVSPGLDFWLLGGISLLVWAVLMVAQNFKHLSFVQQHFTNIAFAAATLALVCNYPHFMASYRLAYSRGAESIKKNFFQLILVPAALIGIFFAAFFAPSVPQQTVVLGHLVNLMFFTVGWHYTKQSFGCTMVYAHFDGYRLSALQKNLLKWNLLGIWFVTCIQSNLYGSSNQFYGMPYQTWDFPNFLDLAAQIYLFVSLALVLGLVFVKNWIDQRQWPSPTMLIPMIAIYVWWLPQARQQDFYLYLTPFFHSLQYLPFVFKVEKHRAEKKNWSSEKWVVLALSLVFIGWAAFEVVPHLLDHVNRSGRLPAASTFGFFIVSFTLFINIHHYFIDNVIWRFKDSEIKSALLK